MTGVGSHWPDEAQALAEFRQEMWRRLMEDSLHSWYDMLERQESSATGIEEPDYMPPLPTVWLKVAPDEVVITIRGIEAEVWYDEVAPFTRTDMEEFVRWMDRRGRT